MKNANTSPEFADPQATAINHLRDEIDAADEAIIDLVRRRTELSRRIGKLRRSAGGPRLIPAREEQVITRYRANLGDAGTRLALLLLEAGRGADEA